MKNLLILGLVIPAAWGFAQTAKTYDNHDGTHTTFQEVCERDGTCHLSEVTTKDKQPRCTIGTSDFADDSFQCVYASAKISDENLTGSKYCAKNHGGGLLNRKHLEKQCKEATTEVDKLLAETKPLSQAH